MAEQFDVTAQEFYAPDFRGDADLKARPGWQCTGVRTVGNNKQKAVVRRADGAEATFWVLGFAKNGEEPPLAIKVNAHGTVFLSDFAVAAQDTPKNQYDGWKQPGGNSSDNEPVPAPAAKPAGKPAAKPAAGNTIVLALKPEEQKQLLAEAKISPMQLAAMVDVAKGWALTVPEFKAFVLVAKHRNLDPLTGQIYAVKRFNKRLGREVMAIQTGIDGFRLIASRTGKYRGQTKPEWCGPDGIWKDVWLNSDNPSAARVGVWVEGFKEPVYGIARWDSYFQQNSPLWGKMGDAMLVKCAESLALRKALPEDLAGIYTAEEMQQGDAEVLAQVEEAPAGKGIPPPAKGPVVDVQFEEPHENMSDEEYSEISAQAAATPAKKTYTVQPPPQKQSLAQGFNTFLAGGGEVDWSGVITDVLAQAGADPAAKAFLEGLIAAGSGPEVLGHIAEASGGLFGPAEAKALLQLAVARNDALLLDQYWEQVSNLAVALDATGARITRGLLAETLAKLSAPAAA